MALKNNKNLIGNIVIIVSIILVAICIFMCFTTHQNNTNSDSLNWNDMHFILIQGIVCDEKTDDMIKFSGGYGRHDIEVNKTNDPNRYNQYIGDTNTSEHIKNGFFRTNFNDTNSMEYIEIDGKWHAFVIPKNDNGTSEKLKGHPTIYEFSCPDKDFLISFTHSITYADPNDDGGVKFVS
ncbi:hypothetical protein [Methanobrevibacter sp.]|uniref:hypothetical protein n=1 Tax=Methanobrevibacter sp. TaxID=66852 RepID=UPI00386A78FB